MEEKIKALLVGVNLNDDPDFENALKELESLAEACDMEVVGVETQNVSQINTGVYVGTGKVDEIKSVAHMLNADVVIFDNTLSPMQLRNLKDIIERPILDRTNLILQIFSSRAQTREAKIQVETARLQYELPRLTGMGEILSRQGGTIYLPEGGRFPAMPSIRRQEKVLYTGHCSTMSIWRRCRLPSPRPGTSLTGMGWHLYARG